MASKELIVAHQKVKLHPFRETFDKEDVNSYRHCLMELKTIFWEEFKKTPQYNGPGSMPNFYHDFGAAIIGIAYYGDMNDDDYYEKHYGKKYVYELKPGYVEHIEKCVNVIHNFINKDIVMEYWTYYGGCNHIEGTDRATKYIYVKETNSFKPLKTLRTLRAIYKYVSTETKENGTLEYSEDIILRAKKELDEEEAKLK